MIPYSKIIHDDDDMPLGARIFSLRRLLPRFLKTALRIDPEEEEEGGEEEEEEALPPPGLEPSPSPSASKRKKVIRHTILQALGRTASSSNLVIAAPGAAAAAAARDSGQHREAGNGSGARPRQGLVMLPDKNKITNKKSKVVARNSNRMQKRASTQRKRKASMYKKSSTVLQRRKQSICLGSHKPRRMSLARSAPVAPESPPSSPSRAEKLALVNQKYHSNKVLPTVAGAGTGGGGDLEERGRGRGDNPPRVLRGEAGQSSPGSTTTTECLSVENSPPKHKHSAADDVHSFGSSSCASRDHQGGAAGIIYASPPCFDPHTASGSHTSSSSSSAHSVQALVPVRTFKNVSIADMLSNAGEEGGFRDDDNDDDDDDDDDDDNSESDSAMGKIIDSSTIEDAGVADTPCGHGSEGGLHVCPNALPIGPAGGESSSEPGGRGVGRGGLASLGSSFKNSVRGKQGLLFLCRHLRSAVQYHIILCLI
jgi:hypothetical protein